MEKPQVDELMKWLRIEARKRRRELDNELLARIKVIEHFAEQLNNDLTNVEVNTAVCYSKLSPKPEAPVSNRPNTIFAVSGDTTITEQMEKLLLKISGAERELLSRLELVSKLL